MNKFNGDVMDTKPFDVNLKNTSDNSDPVVIFGDFHCSKEGLDKTLVTITDMLEEEIKELHSKILDTAVPYAPHTPEVLNFIKRRNVLQDAHDKIYALIEQPKFNKQTWDSYDIDFLLGIKSDDSRK